MTDMFQVRRGLLEWGTPTTTAALQSVECRRRGGSGGRDTICDHSEIHYFYRVTFLKSRLREFSFLYAFIKTAVSLYFKRYLQEAEYKGT